MHRLFLALLLFSAAWPSTVLGQPLAFQHLTTDDGLSDNAITCVYEDRAGFLWIGTENGLDRYDGCTILPVVGITESIAAITEDHAGILWIATRDHGLIRRDPSGALRRFDRSSASAGTMASEKLTALHDLNDTTLLIGSREVTLMFLDKRSFAFTYWTDSTSLSPARAAARPMGKSGWCHAITPLDDEQLWIGLLNFQLSLVADRRSGEVTHWVMVLREGSETQTSAVLRNGLLYTGGWQNGVDALVLRDVPASRSKVPQPTRVIPTADEVTALIPWGTGELLAGIRQGGLLRIDPRTGKTTRVAHDRLDPTTLASDRVRCLLHDRNRTLWVGTANGLDRHVPSTWAFHVQELFGADDPRATELFFHRVEAKGSGGVRIFTSEGFFEQDGVGGPVRHLPFDHHGKALQPTITARDHHGRELIGTEYGIAIGRSANRGPAGALEPFHPGAPRMELGAMYQVRGLQADTVRGRPVLVVATLGYGVEVIDARTAQVFGLGMPVSVSALNTYKLVNGMVRDPRGRYWCASAGGLFSWEPGEALITPGLNSQAPADTSGVLAQGENVSRIIIHHGDPWAVTRSGALLTVSDGRVRRHVPPPGSRAAMFGLAADPRGRIWITTEDGLLRFNPADATFLHVPVNDGRRFRKLTSAITCTSDGRMAFCADNALITFRPEAFDRLPALPSAYLTSASSAGHELDVHDGEVALSYRSSVIEIGVSARAGGFAQPVSFAYRLEGVETEARSLAAGQSIRYAGVPVGEHRLLLRVRDAFGRVGAEQALLLIVVEAPFWRTWWFYALLAAALSLAAVAWSRYRIAQALKLQAVRDRIASDLHDEVGSSLSSITIGSQLAQQLSSGDNEQVKQLLARIGETSSESLRSISDIVWAIDPKNDDGEALVKRVQRIATELLERKGIAVSFSVSGGVQDLKLPMNARKELVLLLKEAVHNASKYSGASTVQVSLHRRNATLAASVKDDGKGFDPELHPDGHGLGSMHRRAQALGGTLSLCSAPGLGTLVGVEVDLTRIRD